MVRPRGLDKAAKPLQSQTEKPVGNPTKKVRVKCDLPHWAVMQQGLHKKTPRNLFQRGYLWNPCSGLFELCCRKKGKKMVRPRGLEPRTQWLRVICSTNWAMGACCEHNIPWFFVKSSRFSHKIQKIHILTIVKLNARSFWEQCAFTMTNSNCAFSLTNWNIGYRCAIIKDIGIPPPGRGCVYYDKFYGGKHGTSNQNRTTPYWATASATEKFSRNRNGVESSTFNNHARSPEASTREFQNATPANSQSLY